MTDNQQIFVTEVKQILKDLDAKLLDFKVSDDCPVWTIEYPYMGKIWSLRVKFDGWSIDVLPEVYWCRPTPIWGWPHTSISGEVCVNDQEGLEYDPCDVKGVLRWLLEGAANILDSNHRISAKERICRFSDELEGYLLNDGAFSISLPIPLDVTKVTYGEVQTAVKGKVSPVTPRVLNINQGTSEHHNCQQQRLGILDVSIGQLADISAEWDMKWWNQFIARLSASQNKIAISKKNHGLVLRVPNIYGHALLLLYKGIHSTHKNRTYVIKRQDHSYLVKRTGSQPLHKHVVIVGCGAIGARVAEHLALAGVEKLTLIDDDFFSPDNLGRHVLGKSAIGKRKVDELAKLLKERMPGINVVPKSSLIQKILASSNEVQSADVIVLATGNSVIERSIIRSAFQHHWRALLVSTSVEAGGLGGHAISMQPGTPGCLDCLYWDPDTLRPATRLRTSLIAPDQKVTRQLTGCGAFTPYSALDATRTATLAVERVLSNDVGYALWVGEAQLAKLEGITASHTYDALIHGRISSNFSPPMYTRPGCPCCGV